jgi:hypothetical protein
MPLVRIVDSYSHMFGEAVLERHHGGLQEEVVLILTSTLIPDPTKASREKTKQGRIVWSGKDFNKPLAREFRRQGWRRTKLYYPGQSRYFIDVDFCKGGVALEIQFGKYSFVQHDFAKFRYLFETSEEGSSIDVGIEVIPCSALQRQMCTGPANFESVVASMKAHARNDPAVPVWVLAIDVQ